MLLARYDKENRAWRSVAFAEKQLLVSDMKGADVSCLGSVMLAQHKGQFYYLQVHWNPSAGCFIVLNDNLSFHDAHTGGAERFFQSGLVISSGNTVHFADVHPETIFLYDPRTRTSSPIYPPPNDPFRSDFSARLQQVINRDLCGERNWACDPSSFSSTIWQSVFINDQTNSVAMDVEFGTDGFLDDAERDRGSQFDDDRYAYVFQLTPFRWREFPIYDLKAKFGTDSLDELVTPEMIKRVFATPAPN